MVLPKRALGPLARGLKRDSDLGPIDNEAGTDDTIDPRDTAAALSRAGRVTGYDLSYSAPRHSSRRRVVGMSTSVELFRTEKAASKYLSKQIADLERIHGRKLPGGSDAHKRRGRFDVGDVGDEASGVRAIARAGENAVFGTVVAFRRGRIVGSANVALDRELVISSDVERIARDLDERRIKRVATARG